MRLSQKKWNGCVLCVVLLLISAIVFPCISHAKMRPISDDVVVSWSPEPPSMFTICWDKCQASFIKSSPPWYGPWFKMKLCPYDDEIVPVIAEFREHLILWPPDSEYFIDGPLGPYCYCDWDGLACKGDWFSGPKTDYGCVGVDNVETKMWKVHGDIDVSTPIGNGGSYWDSKGNPFIKIYFPELITATLEEWRGDIVLGMCSNINPYETCPCVDYHCEGGFFGTCDKIDPHKTLGRLIISNMTVKIHAGGWTQITVRKNEIDLSWLKNWGHH